MTKSVASVVPSLNPRLVLEGFTRLPVEYGLDDGMLSVSSGWGMLTEDSEAPEAPEASGKPRRDPIAENKPSILSSSRAILASESSAVWALRLRTDSEGSHLFLRRRHLRND